MDKKGLGAFTGDASKGNPYEGDRGTGIAYDEYESRFLVPEQQGNRPVLIPVYRRAAAKLIQYLEARQGDNLLDLGSGTGISTLELLVRNPTASVTGVEKSPGMLEVARYKFHQDAGHDLLAHVTDQRLLNYLDTFRQESKPYQKSVQFFKGDVQDMNFLNSESVNHAVGNQVIHWTDLSRSFTEFGRVLRREGTVVWNSSSHFYDDEGFPSARFGFRYNDFLKVVLEDLSGAEGVKNVKNYREMSVPKHTFDSIRGVTADAGFDTEQIGLYLLPVDLQTFSRVHVPMFAKVLVEHTMGEDDFRLLVNGAISRAIVNPLALIDVEHKYDTNPIFRSVKR